MFSKIIPTVYAAASATAATSDSTSGAAIATGKTGAEGVTDLLGFFAQNLGNWIGGIIIIIIAFILAKTTAEKIRNKIIEKKGEEAEESVLVLVQRVSKIVIIGVGITIAAAINGFNFTAVIGALSLGIGFALKDVIGTFISSIVLLAQNRIRIGDLIQFGDIVGTIISIDTRVTVLKALDGSEVVIPNQQMLNTTIISYSTNPFRRVDILVGVAYSTNLPMVTTLIKGIMDKDKDIVAKPASQVLIDAFGESSINLIVRFWVESSTTTNWLDIKSNVANKIKKAFDEVGVTIPFPIRTLKLDENDRAFLKTMDSMKKGIVPETDKIPGKEEVMAVAANTEHEAHIPYKLFQDKSDSIITPVKPSALANTIAVQSVKPDKPAPPPIVPPTHM